MSEKIEPVLSAEEWRVPHAIRDSVYACADRTGVTLGDGSVAPPIGIHVDAKDLPALIAVANTALPDSDPRKITREMLARLRDVAEFEKQDYNPGDGGYADAQAALRDIDALESYLPPDERTPQRTRGEYRTR